MKLWYKIFVKYINIFSYNIYSVSFKMNNFIYGFATASILYYLYMRHVSYNQLNDDDNFSNYTDDDSNHDTDSQSNSSRRENSDDGTDSNSDNDSCETSSNYEEEEDEEDEYCAKEGEEGHAKEEDEEEEEEDEEDEEEHDGKDKSAVEPEDEKKKKCVEDEWKIYSDYNHVYFHTDVSRTRVNRVIHELKRAENICEKIKRRMNIESIPIYLHINSFGGSVTAGLILVDYILASKTPIYSVIDGDCQSMAVDISIVCSKRYIKPNGSLMIHQMSTETTFKKLQQIKAQVEYDTMIDRKMKERLLKHSKMSEKKIKQIWNRDTYYCPEKALKYGLVDEIMK